MSQGSGSIPKQVGWNCSFDYSVNEATVDSELRNHEAFWDEVVTWITIVLAALALVDIILVLRASRKIGESYMVAMNLPRRDGLRREHEELRKTVTVATIIAYIFGGFCGSAALYGTTLQTFHAADNFFGLLFLTSLFISSAIFLLSIASIAMI